MTETFYPIWLKKSEWERLQRQGGRLIQETTAYDTKKEYLDALNEQSRKWMDLWPDSAEGAREKIKLLRRKQRKENQALLDWYKSQTPQDPQAAVRKAKQIIFNDSCYGRQLISAVVKSNTLEEREAQIEFQAKIKQEEAELEKNKKYSPLFASLTDEEIAANRKQKTLECIKFNEEIERSKKERDAKLKAERNACESVDENMVTFVQELETKKKIEKNLRIKKGLEEYEAERKEISKYRNAVVDRDNALTAAYKKEQDTLKCKIDAVYKKIVEEKRHGKRAQKLFNAIDEIQKTETKRYNDFISKGIEMKEQGLLDKETREVEIEDKKRIERYKAVEENQIAGKLHKQYIEHTAAGNKCACEVQTLLFKPDSNKQALKKNKDKIDTGNDMQIKPKESSKDKYSFLKPNTSLQQALRQREKEPSGYTGNDSKDKYFAEQANEALQLSKHKYFARKVVDEYIRTNRLNASDLSINY